MLDGLVIVAGVIFRTWCSAATDNGRVARRRMQVMRRALWKKYWYVFAIVVIVSNT